MINMLWHARDESVIPVTASADTRHISESFSALTGNHLCSPTVMLSGVPPR